VGFSVDYRSTRPVTAAEAEAIDQAAARLCDPPDWVGCEEISFYECLEAYGEGHLSGSSKPDLEAHWVYKIPGVETRIVPTWELIDALCQISRDHQVDWEISHDYRDGPVGYIRSGLADDKLVAEIDRLLAEFEAFREGKEPWA
jgi:hypothetical protein